MDESWSAFWSTIFNEKWRLVIRYFNVGNHELRWNTVSIDRCWEIVRLFTRWKSNESTCSLSRWNVRRKQSEKDNSMSNVSELFLKILSDRIMKNKSFSFRFQLIESCWTFKEALRPTFQQICEYLRQYLNRITPIDYSDLDYVDLPARSSTSISDFVCPAVHPPSSSGIATDSNSHSHITSVPTTTTTSSSSLS